MRQRSANVNLAYRDLGSPGDERTVQSIVTLDRGAYQLVIAPERPCWVAANSEAADMIEELAAETDDTLAIWADRLASRDGLTPEQSEQVVAGCAADSSCVWATSESGDYSGRSAYLTPTHLRELWLHINNRCNFTCRHCLVSSGPDGDDGLPRETLEQLIRDARELGALTFFFTGGEPLMRSDLPDLLTLVLDDPDAHAVALTNGSLIRDEFLEAIADLDRERLHLQVSLDAADPALNDELRSPAAFERATEGIRRAVAAGLDVSVATVVLGANLDGLPDMPALLKDLGVRSWHLMWQHLRERGAEEPTASVQATTEAALALRPLATAAGVEIDNFESFRAVVNGEPRTKHDGSNACWDSLTVYADGGVYPSAALVGVEEMCGGSILEESLRDIWRNSPVFEEYRQRGSLPVDASGDDPLAFFHGGGDPEHAWFFGGGDPAARDPYLPLYREMMLSVMDEIATDRIEMIGRRDDVPVVYHSMGQDGLGCPVRAGVENSGPHRIDFVHSNCVLMQDVVGHSRQIVQDFYGAAAVETKGEVCCPVPVDRRMLDHIPPEVTERSYGCGSPVFAAEVAAGETVVDLGSGVGIECFAASRMAGPTGRIIGVDMTSEMLGVAREAQVQVAANLGYDNVSFEEGFLEDLPVEDATADVVISNCVVNLSLRKHKVFTEVLRILKPGGRMVISDITTGGVVPEAVRFNPRLHSECIGGALDRNELLRMLTKLGFERVQTLHEMPWREVGGAEFFSDTVVAYRPTTDAKPLPYVGIERATGEECCCEEESCSDERHLSDCMVCGAPLQYLQTAVGALCSECGRAFRTRCRCQEGHFICDQCHGGDYLRFVRSFISQTESTDPVELFLEMRDAYPFSVHGPEHHALAPAAFLTAWHNLHGYPDPEAIWQAVQTCAELPGGTCAFWGGCSAALGIGVAFAAIMETTPVSTVERGRGQDAVARILQKIASFNAARCCRRESLLSLQMACELSEELLPAPIATATVPTCDQMWLSQECIGANCPFFGGTDEEQMEEQ